MRNDDLCDILNVIGGENVSEKKRKAKWQNDYIAKAYDRVNLIVPKGDKDKIKAHADSMEESVNGFINRAIEEAMIRDNAVSEE